MGALGQIIALADRVDRWAKRSMRSADEYVALDSATAVIHRVSTPVRPGPHPLVLTLHGFGSDVHQMATLVPLPQTSPSVHLVAVRGDWTIADGGYAWFPITGSNPADVTADEADIDEAADFLADVIAALTADSTIDANQVWIIGYSQGAAMALHLLCRHPELICGVAVGAGTFIGARGTDADLSPKHCFIAGSSSDPFVLEAGYDRTEDMLRRAGATVTVATENVPHVISTTHAEAIDKWLSDLIE